MSNIYIQEPSANGKVLLNTTVGDIDIELWSKEAPKACRNFVQLCLEGYYDDTIFHRVVPDFIVQGGDPDGTGEGGESVYGAPFKDEFHSRLRFVRRGLVAMANAGPNDNASQFFFTMNQTPELQNKHTIFGKVAGQTLYNMLRLQEVETDGDDRPLDPHKIIKSEVLVNPFDDIIPRSTKKSKKDDDGEKKVKSKSKATKNFSLLSFGSEAEEDEEQSFKASKKFSGKSKSSHDLIDDPNLSSVPVVEKRKNEEEEPDEEAVKMVQKKLKKEENLQSSTNISKDSESIIPEDTKSTRLEEARKESKKLQKDLKAAKKKSHQADQTGGDKDAEEKEEADINPDTSDFLEKFKLERQKYLNIKKQQKKKGGSREEQTLAMLAKFQSKLSSVKQLTGNYSDSDGEKDTQEEEKEDESENSDLAWLSHKLTFEADEKNKVLDANVADADRYEIHDPRNPMTQRRREASKKKAKQK